MRKALFDRSTLWNVNDYIHGSITEKSTNAFMNIIYTTILWDGIFVCPYGETDSGALKATSMPQKMKKTMEILEENGIRYVDDNTGGYDYDYIYSWLEKTNPNSNPDEIRDLTEVIYYQKLSNALGTDLFLSIPRQKIIEKYKLTNENNWNRIKPVLTIEKDILNYSRELQDKFGIEGIKIETPLLVDYVVNQSNDIIDALKVAKQISEEKDVLAFKKAMDNLENCINEKKLMEVGIFLKSVNEIVPDLEKKYTTDRKVVIKPIISIMYNMPISLGIEFGEHNINFSKIKRKRDIGFLIKLAKYGLLRKYIKTLSIKGFICNNNLYIPDLNVFTSYRK